MPITAGQTGLFTLPLELRQLIYHAVLSSPLHNPDLLRTCREIHAEAHKFLFERPLSFRSQVALFDWLDLVPIKYLAHVRELSLNIQDVDLRSLLNPSALISHPGDPPRLLTWDLYEAELQKLYHALKQLPQVSKITIRAVTGRQSFLYREFLQRFLVLLSSVYPHLLEIQLEGNLHYQDLSFLNRFADLQALSFDGFSASSPFDTAKILSGLEHLTSLSLVAQSAMLAPDSHTRSNFTTNRQSLTGPGVNGIDSLKCFSVTEVTPITAPTLFFTPEVLTSLHDHQGLKVLKVCLSQAPNVDTMTSLENFLEKTNIRFLELDWPHLDPHMLEAFSLIPDTLEQFWIRVMSAANAFDIMWSVAQKRCTGDICALRELVLLRSTKTYDNFSPVISDRKDSGTGSLEAGTHSMQIETGEAEAAKHIRARSRLTAFGIRISWCTERV